MILSKNKIIAAIFRQMLFFSLCNFAVFAGLASADERSIPADTLAAEFSNPPNDARPRVWWHWISGNITKEGIDKDLAWMQRVGIGGVQHFDVGLTSRQIVETPLRYMSPEWKDAFRFAATTAQERGLEMTIASSPGWSETGGPWVKPDDAMKKVVWSETLIAGGRRFQGALALPSTATGPYQGLSMEGAKATFYADSHVLAYPDIEATTIAPPRYTSGGETLDATAFHDDSLDTSVRIVRLATGEAPTVTMSYANPTTIRSATIFIKGAWTMFQPPTTLPRLEVHEKSGWRTLAQLPVASVPTTVSFAAVTAREFRLVADADPSSNVKSLGSIRIADLRLSPTATINRFQVKAGFALAPDYYALASEQAAEVKGIDPRRVIDITERMAADGTLDWTPPPGRWRVLRLGYSLLGITNHPATPDTTGLEVDKYDADAVRSYMEHYIGMYRAAAGADLLGARGVRALLTDSIETGASNWTPKMLAQFQRLRGYDARPWLPTLTGAIVESRAASDAFLYDFRRTLADLIASEHYGQVARSAHAAGLQVYGESQEGGRAVFGDDMSMRAHADVPMAALWTFAEETGPAPSAIVDMRGAASVAHVYGRRYVAAESMTSAMKPWAFGPADLRRIIDLEFANGINRPVIHTSVHQPIDKAPGISLSVFGQYFNRLETWAEMARPWMDYLARSSYLLQQGVNVADVAYFSGEEAPLTAPHGDEPTRYAYDYVNADMLRDALVVEGGEIIAKGGARYRALYLGGSSDRMTVPTLRRLNELVENGAIVIGHAPIASPSRADDPAEFRRLVEWLWAGGDVTTVGQGKVFASRDTEATLAKLGATPDFSNGSPAADSRILFVHRRDENGDIYFLNNSKNRAEQLEARFRVTGRRPAIWRADTGQSEPVSYRIEGNETVVSLAMNAHDSFFVVFREPATAASAAIAQPMLAPIGEIAGPWSVAFQPERGAPPKTELPVLASLSEQNDPGIKYFSGIATYTKTFTLPKGARRGAPLWLDLGRVGDVAEVRVNDQLVGIAWKVPYRLDIGHAVKSGRNTLDIRVANLWVNRLIGDAQPDAQKVTFTVFPTYSSKAPLQPSGLLGPVQLLAPAPDNTSN
jgi:(4-O-methyl)-D-glucuronate---lignin esterase